MAPDSRTSNRREKATYEERIKDSVPSDVNFHERGEKFIPFATIKMPPESVKDVRLSPRFGDDLDESAIKL